ncbi:MAG: molybdenum cofactor guanylyltransferase [Alphaproteobacteria bacterium]|nr:molybdenum cofactor guanylyltransferase [Alphaproteobacteria bacterium]
MRLLGALIAGGQSRRFGSDKAQAPVHGKPLLDHVIAALNPQVEAMVICGRHWSGLLYLPDRPEPDQGPLGGLCAALHHAREDGFDAVLTAGCDTLPVPDRLAGLLDYQSGVIRGQPLFGFWFASMTPMLDAWLADQPRRDMRGWIDHSGAHEVNCSIDFSNVNTREEYDRFIAPKGMTT